jgi:hypothetical protein
MAALIEQLAAGERVTAEDSQRVELVAKAFDRLHEER